MPIGTSDGEYFDDALSHSISIAEGGTPAGSPERLYVSPGRAPGSPEKPTGALKPEEGTETPGKGSQQELGTTSRATESLPDVTNERRHDFLERIFIDAGNAIGSIGRGETPMWALDQTTGEFHTSPEGIEAASKLTPFVMTGAISPTIHLRGEGYEALQQGHANFQQFLANEGPTHFGREEHGTDFVDRQGAFARGPQSLEQQPWETSEGPGHPMDPREAAEHYVNLHREGDQQSAIDFARQYENQATSTQFNRYVDHLDYLDRSGQEHGFRQTIEHNPNERRFDQEEFNKFVKDLTDAEQGDKIKLIKDEAFSRSVGNHQFKYASKAGTGDMSITERMGGRDLWVNWTGTSKLASGEHVTDPYEQGPWTFGKTEIKSLLDQIKEQFPNAERIGGFRVSGARVKSGSGSANAWMRIRPKKSMEPITNDRAQETGMQAVEGALRLRPSQIVNPTGPVPE